MSRGGSTPVTADDIDPRRLAGARRYMLELFPGVDAATLDKVAVDHLMELDRCGIEALDTVVRHRMERTDGPVPTRRNRVVTCSGVLTPEEFERAVKAKKEELVKSYAGEWDGARGCLALDQLARFEVLHGEPDESP